MHAFGEATHGFFVVRRGFQCLGQSEIAPTGVLSSWETLATKSLRISSVRVISVRSSASSRMYSQPSMAARTDHDGALAERPPGKLVLLLQNHAIAADLCGHVRELLVNHGVAANRAVGVGCRTRADYAVDRIDHHKGAPDDGKHLRGTFRKQGFGNIQSTILRCRSLILKASMPKTPSDRPTKPATTPISNGSTCPAYALESRQSVDPMPNGGGSTNVHLKVRNRSLAPDTVTGWTANSF